MKIVKNSALFSLAIASVLLAIVDDVVPDNECEDCMQDRNDFRMGGNRTGKYKRFGLK